MQIYLFFKTLQQNRLIGTDYKDLLDNIESMQQHRLSLILDDLKAAKESENDTHKRCRTHFERHRF